MNFVLNFKAIRDIFFEDKIRWIQRLEVPKTIEKKYTRKSVYRQYFLVLIYYRLLGRVSDDLVN